MKLWRMGLLLCLVAMPACSVVREAVPSGGEGGFTRVATLRGVGVVLASLVGPGPAPGSQMLYQSYLYETGTLDIVAVDPETGQYQVFPGPVPGETGAWAMILGPDRTIYIGTLPHAHILQLNPQTGVFTDKGRPSETEEYIWEFAPGSDGKLYGCTYPSAKLIRFDPATGTGEDLGRMDPAEHYARHIAASDDGFVYLGIGYAKADLVAYEIASGQRRAILPPQLQGTGVVSVARHDDGKIYASLHGHFFRLDGWEATEVPAAQVPGQPATNRLPDGRSITAADGRIHVEDPKTNQQTEFPFGYAGKEKRVFRLGMGPDGMLYGSGYMPARFFRINPTTGDLAVVGILGVGELFSMVSYGGHVLASAYYGEAPLMSYDPSRPFASGTDPQANPMLVHYPGEDVEWRPVAMIVGPGSKIYLGAVPGYGRLGGPLTVWDPATNEVRSYAHVVPDQSVISLTTAQGMLVGGTTVAGGGGSHPTKERATLFLWDPAVGQKVFEMPVPARAFFDLITAPNGRVYGFGDNRLLTFDPVERRLVSTSSAPLPGRLIYNSVGLASDGRLWGLTSEGVFSIDPETDTVHLMDKAPEPITGGFALDGHSLYFAAGPHVYRYRWPSTR